MTKYITGGPPRFQHQKRGLRKMIETKGVCALLFDPGLGKTSTVLDYVGLLALKSPTREARVLVICPLAATDTWVLQSEIFMSPQVNYWAEALGGSLLQRAEALAARGGDPYRTHLGGKTYRTKPAHPRAQWWEKSTAWQARREGENDLQASEGPDALLGPRPRVVLEVVNLDTFSSRSTVGSKTMADVMLDAVRRFSPDLVVVDESHRIKSASSNVSRLLSRIGHVVPRRVILTGTVMPTSPVDVFGQWRFLAPYAFGSTRADGTRRTATFGAFKSRYCIYGGWMGKEITGFQRLDEMQDIMAENAEVARKEDALDLPETTDVTVPVHLSPRESKAYAEMKSDLSVQISSDSFATETSRLTQMLRLRQITSGFIKDDHGELQHIGSSKARTIASLVSDTLTGEKRIVIFALFRAEIDLLADLLDEPGTEVQVITGDTSAQERQRMRKRFGSDDPQRMVMVAQIKTMSLAVNELVTASHAIFASMSQQRDDYVQARDRLNRLGQERPVTFWHATASGTVDEVILDVHRDRGDLEARMLKHVQGEGEKDE